LKARALVLLALLGVLACRERYDAERDAALKQQLTTIRGAIAAYRRDTGEYPGSLEALVPKYLPKIPADPITKTTNWRLTTEETVAPSSDFSTSTSTTAAAPSSVVIGVNSAAPGADRDSVLYSNY
jgi:type II secretory pathway pseudopilin PulG